MPQDCECRFDVKNVERQLVQFDCQRMVEKMENRTERVFERVFVSRHVISGKLSVKEGRPKGSRTCDFLEVVRFLALFKRKARNVYQIYHGSRRFDHKKLYRYLRYCQEVGLLELDHIRQDGFLPAKFYRLTAKGQAFLDLFSDLVKIVEMGG